MESYLKKGYLHSAFRLFHITDQTQKTFSFHYHDFDKLLIFLRGDVSYIIEGKSYLLQPYDIVLVRHNEIHKPMIHSTSPYERIVVYISPHFIDSYRTEDYDLGYCFQKSAAEHSGVLRILSPQSNPLPHAITRLEQAFQEEDYATDLYRQVLFLEFMIHLNRAVRHNSLNFLDTTEAHPKIQHIVRYINEHLTNDLSIDEIAGQFYMSRYHMMRTFKEETGFTIGHYITQKRLAMAREQILHRFPITQVCYDCGFKDYSTFSRAYKKAFQESPRETQKRHPVFTAGSPVQEAAGDSDDYNIHLQSPDTASDPAVSDRLEAHPAP